VKLHVSMPFLSGTAFVPLAVGGELTRAVQIVQIGLFGPPVSTQPWHLAMLVPRRCEREHEHLTVKMFVE
jgi:hypothetical protein